MTAPTPVTQELLLATSDCLAALREAVDTTPYDSEERWLAFDDLTDVYNTMLDLSTETLDNEGLTLDAALLNTAMLLINHAL